MDDRKETERRSPLHKHTPRIFRLRLDHTGHDFYKRLLGVMHLAIGTHDKKGVLFHGHRIHLERGSVVWRRDNIH
jgi:hypothetical protein